MQAYVTGPVFTPPSLDEDPATGKKGTLRHARRVGLAELEHWRF